MSPHAVTNNESPRTESFVGTECVINSNTSEPLAIIGFSLRFPQDATTPEDLWQVLVERRDLMTTWPEDRMKFNAFYHQNDNRQTPAFIPGAHFLREDLGAFDAKFFGISAAESASMDVQHRILLETTYHALENAGITMAQVFGSNTGVYTGSMADDYQKVVLKDIDNIPKYSVTGVAQCMIANRLSWFYNLNGPSINLDSACSSSLMAVDFACKGLQDRSCNMAIVTGSSLVLAAETTLSLNNLSMLSPDARSFSFDSRANGYSRGEGFSVIIIKRLSDAIRDGDTIRSIIRSTGSNQDGKTPGVTQPSRDLQARLIRETYQKAGMSMQETRFFEAHGTGTPLGDPLEADAIGSTFRRQRSKHDPLYIGALKSNIGHLEGGSGLAGLIKTIMVLEKGMIPPNANFDKINPKIDAEFLNIKFPTESVPWPTPGLRRASVASFGFGGSNSHVVMDDAFNYLRLRSLSGNHLTSPSPALVEPCLKGEHQNSETLYSSQDTGTESSNGVALHSNIAISKAESQSEKRERLLVFSAADEQGINRLTTAYESHFSRQRNENEDTAYLDHLAYTLAQGRSRMAWKSFVILNSFDLLQSINSLVSKPLLVEGEPGLAFVFTGQGAQYRRMGFELLDDPTFRETLDLFDKQLLKLGCSWSVVALLNGDTEDQHADGIDDPECSQLASTAIQIALFELLSSLGAKPRVVIGHSSGEIAAAYASGALDLTSACKVSYHRGRLASELKKTTKIPGAMISVDVAEGKAIEIISRLANKESLCVACINSPSNITVSGHESEVDSLERLLKSEHIHARKLKTGVAYHSPGMSCIARSYARSIQDIKQGPASPKRPLMISSVNGEYVHNISNVCKPDYWVRNLVSPVQFDKAIALLSKSVDKVQTQKLGAPKLAAIHDLVEIGPHSALRRPILSCLECNGVAGPAGRYHSSLVRQSSARTSVLQLVGELFARGHPLAVGKANLIGGAFSVVPHLLVDLPYYPFDHSKTYWYESPFSKHSRIRNAPKKELLGVPVSDWNPLEPRWRKFFDLSKTPWKGEHIVNGKPIYPATGMVVMAIEAAKQVADPDRTISGYRIQDAVFSAPIVVQENTSEVQLHMRSRTANSDKNTMGFEFCVYSAHGTGWFENCHGTVQVLYHNDRDEEAKIFNQRESQYYNNVYNEARDRCRHHVATDEMYQKFVENGLTYGPSFQGLFNLAWDGSMTAVGDVRCFRWDESQTQNTRESHVAHPTTVDAAGQLAWVILTKGAKEQLSNGFAATRIQDMWISNSGVSYPNSDCIHVHSKSRMKGLRETDCSLFALDQRGNLVLQISHFETTMIGQSEGRTHDARPRQLCFDMEYRPDISLMDREQLKAYTSVRVKSENEPVEFYQDLEMVLFYFARQVWDSKGSLITPKSMPHMENYVRWLNHQMNQYENGDLAIRKQRWGHRIADTPYMESLIRKVETSNSEGEFFVRVGRQLSAIIQGTKDPLELMFHDGLVERHYQEVCHKTAGCKMLPRYLELLSHKNPQLSVLEVGAGTGSMTGHVLEGLGTRFSRYVYTDISETFFGEAKNKFPSSKIKYQALDIERDPADQGYELESFDLVVAAWVLHATRDLKSAIANVRRLLKPYGKLVLFEIVKPEILRNGFAFGTLPGWWLSKETERQWSPCVSVSEWSNKLSSNGFESVDLVLDDYESRVCHESSVIIATCNSSEQLACPPTGKGDIILLVSCHTGVQNNVAAGLKYLLEKQNEGINCEVLHLQEGDVASKVPRGAMLVILAELDQSYLSSMNEQSFDCLKVLFTTSEAVVWLASSPKTSPTSPEREMIKGLARVISTEKPGLSFVTLHFESELLETETYTKLSLDVVEATRKSQTGPTCELEYIERGGVLMINRVYASEEKNLEIHTKTHRTLVTEQFAQSGPLVLTITNPGLLDSISWKPDPQNELGSDEIEIEVHAIGVNFRDLLVVLGKFNASTVGCECSGIVTKVGENCTTLQPGDRVCACVLGCARTHVRCHYNLAVKIPEEMSMEEGASVPITGVTAYYSLVALANLHKDDSILIHSATGGTGQMALQIAQAIGAEVYITVGTDEKRQFARNYYGVPDDHIFSSRDLLFPKDILRSTSGKGVDVVLNSLSGQALFASWECIAPFGRFIELGKADIQANTKLPMSRFSGEVSFHAVAVDYITEHRPAVIQKHLQEVMNLLRKKVIKACSPLEVYPISEAEAAFRVMQSGKNIGKTVLTMSPSDSVPTWISPAYSCKLEPNSSYLICGGLGGLGRSAARWMAQQGARYLILLSRSGPKSKEAQKLIADLQQSGVTVRTPQCDASVPESLAQALKNCEDMPPIQGCLQATLVLRDNLFEMMNWHEWSGSICSKVPTTWNLHEQLPRDLSFFIILSSVAGVAGSLGQSNYAAGNTYQDALATHRVAIGQKAVAINLGWMGDVGIVFENSHLTKGKEAAGDLMPVFETEFLALLDHYCNPDLSMSTLEQTQVVVGLVAPSQFKRKGMGVPEWIENRPLLYGLARDSEDEDDSFASKTHHGLGDDRNWQAEFLRASSLAEATSIVVDALIHKLSKATSTAQEEISRDKPLHTYGVDSLLAVEIRNWFAKTFKSDVAIFDITGQASIEKISEGAASQSTLTPK